MKKIAMGCAILVVLVIGFMCLTFYTLSLPKYRDAAKDKPFLDIINKNLTTKRPVLILKNPDIPKYENYSYHLEDGNGFGMDSDLEVIAEIPIGTAVTIKKTEIHTGRVSGTSHGYLFGEIYSEETQEYYHFEYNWGNYHSLYEEKPYWTFNLAFWQNKPLTEKYYIKVP